MSPTSIEYRLNHLESMLGIDSNHDIGENVGVAPLGGPGDEPAAESMTKKHDSLNLQSRTDNLLDSISSLFGENLSVGSKLDEIDDLSSTLCPPGLLLNSMHALNSSSSGGAYRKQEILARYDELLAAFELLEKIRDLITVSHPSLVKKLQVAETAVGGVKVEGLLDDIASAPIFASSSFDFAADPSNRKKLSDLTKEVMSLREKSLSLSERMDHMIDDYYSKMSAMNEKMVILKEGLGRKKKC